MLRLKISYSSHEEKEKLINDMKNSYNLVKISKDYPGKQENSFNRIYVDLSPK